MSSDQIETKHRILKSAWALIEVKGPRVRMSDIAKEAGISRQAVYLHFRTRSELLIATTRYIDDVKGVQERFEKSRLATGGLKKLEAFSHAWIHYIPEIYGIAKALLALKESDEATASAWEDRMAAVRAGCRSVVKALKKDGLLTKDYTLEQSVDLLYGFLSVRHWEQFVIEQSWTQEAYLAMVHRLISKMLLNKP